MLFENIQKNHGKLAITKACMALNTGRHAYAAWLARPTLQPDPLTNKVKKVADENICYGYRKITKQLQRQDIKINHKRVLKIMQERGLIRKIKHFRICTTNSNHDLKKYPNLIKGMIVIKLNQVWVADITYIILSTGKHTYLAVVMDRFSRKFIGWQLSEEIDTQLCLDALNMAFKERKDIDLTGLIHHSDQGIQYASNEYTATLLEKGIQISMSRKGNPYDNAHMESANKTIKCEEVYMNEYNTIQEAKQNIKKFIEKVYNKKRLHSSIGYLPPNEFEEQYLLNGGAF